MQRVVRCDVCVLFSSVRYHHSSPFTYLCITNIIIILFFRRRRERERGLWKSCSGTGNDRHWVWSRMVCVCVCVVCIRRQHCDRQTLQCIRADWRLPNAKTMCGPRRQSYNWSKTLASSVMCWLWRGYICSMGPQIVWRLGVWHIAHHHQSSHLYLFSDNSAASINSRRNRKKKKIGIVKVKKISLCVVLLFYLNMVVVTIFCLGVGCLVCCFGASKEDRSEWAHHNWTAATECYASGIQQNPFETYLNDKSQVSTIDRNGLF